MKNFTKVNLNDKIRFKITPHGEKAVKDEYLYYLKTKQNKKGYCETELWLFASIFGPYLYNGCDIPVEAFVEIQITD